MAHGMCAVLEHHQTNKNLDVDAEEVLFYATKIHLMQLFQSAASP